MLENFYFTYEELKREALKENEENEDYFYFTYEELKQSKVKTGRSYLKYFYFTYEELKLVYSSDAVFSVQIFTLPMRN